MADDEYTNKIRDLQKYVPFLENTIRRLKSENGTPREAQISKLQSLLVILTDTKKKLKYDALKKCEEVILKLYDKVKEAPTESMHKYMCRNPPEDSVKTFTRELDCSIDPDVAFSVARQKLNKQAEMTTPTSPSPPLEHIIVSQPVVIPTEKINDRYFRSSSDSFKALHQMNFTEDGWTNINDLSAPKTNLKEIVICRPVAPVVNVPVHTNKPVTDIRFSINRPGQMINNPGQNRMQFQPQRNWQSNDQLYLRRHDLRGAPSSARFNVWNKYTPDIAKVANKERELVDYGDAFTDPNIPLCNHENIVTPTVEVLEKPAAIEKEFEDRYNCETPIAFSNTPEVKDHVLPNTLSKPPLTESDLQDLLATSNVSPSEQSMVNEDLDLDKLEELRLKINKELEQNKKPHKSKEKHKHEKIKTPLTSPTGTCSSTMKTKSTKVVERVIKEPDNIFGSLLSSLDEQIMVKDKVHKKIEPKAKEEHKREEKKVEKKDSHKKIDKKESDLKKEEHKKVEKKDCTKKDDLNKKSETKDKADSKQKEIKDKATKIDIKPKEDKSKEVTKVKDVKSELKHKDRSKSSSIKSKEDLLKLTEKVKSSVLKDDVKSSDSESSKKKILKVVEVDMFSVDPTKTKDAKQKETVKQKSKSDPKPKESTSKSDSSKVKDTKKDDSKDKDDSKVRKSSSKDESTKVVKSKDESTKVVKSKEDKSKMPKSVSKDSDTKVKVSDIKEHSSSSVSDDNKKTVEKLMKDLQDIANPNRISDKYPHKRRLSELPKPPKPLDPRELAKLIETKPTKQKIPNTEVHPSKLQDPRLRKSLGLLSPPPQFERKDSEPESFIRSSEFQNPSVPSSSPTVHDNRFLFQNEPAPLLNRPDRPPSNFMGQQIPIRPLSSLFPNDPNHLDQSRAHAFPNDSLQIPNKSHNMFNKEPLLETPQLGPRSQNVFQNDTHGLLDIPQMSNRSQIFQNTMHDSQHNMFSNNEQMGSRTPMYEEPEFNEAPHISNIGHNMFQNECQDIDMRMGTPDSFQAGNMTPGDPFLMPNTNLNQFPEQNNRLDVSMRGGHFPNKNNRNFDNDQNNSGQFWNISNPNQPDQLNIQQNNFNNFGNNFPQNQQVRFQGLARNQPQQQQRFQSPNIICNIRANQMLQNQSDYSNSYDLSQMNPIDFYDQSQDNQEMHNTSGRGKSMFDQNNDYNSGKTRPFRGRGGNRGFNRGRGNPRFWAPANRVEEESRKFVPRTEEPKDERRRYGREDSKEDNRRYRSNRDESREDPRRHREDSRDDSRKVAREDPRRHRNESREDTRRQSATRDESKEDPRRYSSREESKEKRCSNSRDEQPRDDTMSKSKPVEETVVKPKPVDETVKTDKLKDDHYSPLDSLYASDAKQKIGKGYGFQNFKIPKIKRNSIDEVKAIPKKESSEEKDNIKKEDEVITIADDVKIEEEMKNEENNIKKNEEIQKDVKDEPDTHKSEKDQFMDLLKKTFESNNSDSFLQILQTFGLFNQAKTKKIRRIIQSDSDDSEEDQPPPTPEIKEQESKEEKPEEILPVVIPEVPKQIFEPPGTPEKQPIEPSVADNQNITDSVIESVGERIKNRRRNKTESSPDSSSPKDVKVKVPQKKGTPRPRRRNALEMLQDDIKEMFISEGVLTANGQRMCRTMKAALDNPNLNSSQSELESKKNEFPIKKIDSVTSTTDDEDMPLIKRKRNRKTKTPTKLDSDKSELVRVYPKRTRSSPRVMLEKMDNSEMSKYMSNENDDNYSENSENDDLVQNERKSLNSKDPESFAYSTSGKNIVKKRSKKLDTEDEIEKSVEESMDEDGSVDKDDDEDEKKLNVKACNRKKKKQWALGIIKKKRLRNKFTSKSPSITSAEQSELNDALNDVESVASMDTTSQISEDEDDFLMRTDLVPDLNYYLDNRTKYDCKLCDYRGKMIVPHYRIKHHESENMISRLNPIEAKNSKEESQAKDFQSIEAYDEMIKSRKRRQTFVCRFCNSLFKHESVAVFYDHLCCHTGEYRHCCEHCMFTTAHRKALSNHYHNIHPDLPMKIIPKYTIPPNFRIVFGYICVACNFTQLIRDHVETHVNVSHPGQTIEILKISMSSQSVQLPDNLLEAVEDEIAEETISEEAIDKESEETLEDAIEDYVEEPEKLVEPPKEPDLTAFMASEDVSAQEKLIEDERLKKMQEINSNITPRRLTLQFLDKLKTKLDSHQIDEIHDEITIDEQLLHLEPITKDDLEDPEEEIIDVIPESPVIVSETEEAPGNWISIANTCSLANSEETELEDLGNLLDLSALNDARNSDTESSIEPEEQIDVSEVELPLPTDSKQKRILNTIQRLAENIKNPKPQTIPASALETNQSVEETGILPWQYKVVDVGPIQVRFNDKSYEYICMIPTCGFKTIYKISFTKHCSEQHKNLTFNCSNCVDTTKKFTMMSLFVHLFDKHKANAKVIVEKVTDIVAQPKGENVSQGKIRIRRISGDVLSSFGMIQTPPNPQIKPETSAPEPELIAPLITPIETQANELQNEADLAGLFQISDVRTLTAEEETHLQLKFPNANLSPVKPTSNVLSSETDAPLNISNSNILSNKPVVSETKKRVFIMPLSKLMDSADKDPNFVKIAPKLELKEAETTSKNVAPVPRASPQTLTNKVINPEDTPIENVIKTPEAIARLLKFPHILFKCPFETCTYSTNRNFNFMNHLNKHKNRQPVGTFCVYCSSSVRLGSLVTHVQKEHAHCLYQCAYCFYRAVVPSYVKIHQKNLHQNEQINVIHLQPFENLQAPPEETLPRIQTIKPYICKLECKYRFILVEAFQLHIQIYHPGNYICSICVKKEESVQKLIEHYGVHGIGMYQCRFCLHGTSNPELMHQHYGIQHPGMLPTAYVRQFIREKEKKSASFAICLEDIEIINLDKLNANIISSIEHKQMLFISKYESKKDQQKESIPPITSPPLAVSSTTIPTASPPLAVLKSIVPTSVSPVPVAPPVTAPKAAAPTPNPLSDLIDILDENPQPSEELLEVENLNEPLVTLKHRTVASRNAIENAIDPLMIDVDAADDEPDITEEKNADEASDNSNDLNGSKRGHSGSDLFKCGSPNCHFKATNLRDFKSHMFSCESLREFGGWYNCIHCQKRFKFVGGLMDHIQIHGTQRFICSMCSVRAPLSHLIVKHMKLKHKINNVKLVPSISKKKDLAVDCFVAMPCKLKARKTKEDCSPEHSDNNSQPSTSTVDEKNVYGPDDIERLPRPPVYSQEIHCKLCSYNTKVRSNMQRHLQQHQDEMTIVPETAPVNPVPCLEKNEKMFDKMTNLAASSLCGPRMGGKSGEKAEEKRKEEEAALPGFIPVNKRYVCGAGGCNYLTHGETMLRHHFRTLHLDELTYKCPHCNLQLETDLEGVTLENILCHLKMHDLHLYKCTHCTFYHYQKNKVDKHVADKHPDRIPYIHVIRELDASANSEDSIRSVPLSSSSSVSSISTLNDVESKPWCCGFCSFRCPTRIGIQAHAVKIHGIKSQFKCGLCHFRCSAKNNYNSHFKTKHPNVEVNITSVFFRSVEDSPVKANQLPELPAEPEVFDTTPLWSRDKPRIRHIRGILLDDSKSNKKSQKSVEKFDLVSEKTRVSNLEKTVDEVAKNLFGEGEVKVKEEKKKEDIQIELKFGPDHYGTPVKNMYTCPYCFSFTSTSVKRFITHLYVELSYYRCVCNYCDSKFTDISLAKYHFSKDHSKDYKDENISPLTSDGRIERWVEKCVQYQQKEIKRIEEENALFLLEKATRPLDRVYDSPEETIRLNFEELETTPSEQSSISDLLKTSNEDNENLFEFSEMPVLFSEVPVGEKLTDGKETFFESQKDQSNEIDDESSEIKRQFFEIQGKTSEIEDNTSVTDEEFLQIQEKYFEMKKKSLEIQRQSLEIEKKSLKIQEKALKIGNISSLAKQKLSDAEQEVPANVEKTPEPKKKSSEFRELTPEINEITAEIHQITPDIHNLSSKMQNTTPEANKISPVIQEKPEIDTPQSINGKSPEAIKEKSPDIPVKSPRSEEESSKNQEGILNTEKKVAPKRSAIVTKYLGILEKSNIAGQLMQIRESPSGIGIKSPRIAEKLQRLSGKATKINLKTPIVIKKSARIGIRKSPIKYVTISGISALQGQSSQFTEVSPKSITKPVEKLKKYDEISGISSLNKNPSETIQSFIAGNEKYSFVSLSSSESSEISSIPSSQTSEKSTEESEQSSVSHETLVTISTASSETSESNAKISEVYDVSSKSLAKILGTGKKLKLKSILKSTQIKYVNTDAIAKAVGPSKRTLKSSLRPSKTSKITEVDAIFSDSDDQTLNTLRSNLKSSQIDNISLEQSDEKTSPISVKSFISNKVESSPISVQTIVSSEKTPALREKPIENSSDLESYLSETNEAVTTPRKGKRTRGQKIKKETETIPIETAKEDKPLKSEAKAELTDESDSGESLKKNALKCSHCPFIAKTMSTLQKHTKRHFDYKPFQCAVCKYQTITMRGLNKHFSTKHPNMPIEYKELPPSDVLILQPINKRKRGSLEALSDLPNEKVQKSDLNLVKSEASGKTGQELSSYVCLHCPRRSEKLDVIRDHFFEMHEKIFKGVFRYKKVTLDKTRKIKYTCRYCNWHGHPDALKQHHLELHIDKSWILDKALRYRCAYCPQLYSKLYMLRKHCHAVHKNQPFAYTTLVSDSGEDEILDSVEIIEETIAIKPEPKVIKCDYCADTFIDASQLVNHHNLLHSHLELKADIPAECLKKYKCPHPTCTHSSNSYPSMRDHLRCHNKPYKCHYCPLTGCYPNVLKTHHVKEHRSLPFKYDQVETAQKLNEELRDNLLILNSDGIYQSKSNTLKRQSTDIEAPAAKILALDPSAMLDLTSNQTTTSGAAIRRSNIAKKSTAMPPKIEKHCVARKSTTPHQKRMKQPEGYSFYGTKARDISDYKNVMSEINIMGKTRPINVVAMSHVLNLFPKVLVEDCRKNSNI